MSLVKENLVRLLGTEQTNPHPFLLSVVRRFGRKMIPFVAGW